MKQTNNSMIFNVVYGNHNIRPKQRIFLLKSKELNNYGLMEVYNWGICKIIDCTTPCSVIKA